MTIKILGSGCSKCKKLESNTKEAMEKLGINLEIIKIQDAQEIASYGIMSTPAIVIDEKIKSYGKVASVNDIIKFIQDQK